MNEISKPAEFTAQVEKSERIKMDIIPLAIWERDIANMVKAAHEHGEPVKSFMLWSLRRLTDATYKGKEEKLSPFLAELEARDYSSEQEMISIVASEIYKFGKANLTPRELESNLRNFIVDKEKFVLNEMLHCELREDGELFIHVFPVSTLTIGEKLKLLRDGFKQLAQKLRTDAELKGVETIHGLSWIIAQNPSLLEKLGFTYDGNISEEERKHDFPYDPRKVGKAHIDVEKFLELYT